ncbi:MAG: transcriptional regulator MraZ [Confluentimicrobium sp.]|nr:transcriptional regulator MraZ [Actibacterium sp.]
MKSHGIPWSSDEDGLTGAVQEPRTKAPSQVSYRHPLSPNTKIRRASEQTSPQVACVAGHPQRWDEGGGLGSGSSSIRRFRFRRPKRQQRSVGTVARRFRGEYTFKVDAKGRVSIPALFRRVLEAGDPSWTEGLRPELVIVYGDHRRKFLEVYTIEAIEEVSDQIEQMQRGSPERRMLERLINGQSHPTEVDGDGRLVLPQKLREKIGLEGEAFFIASGDTFQIWKPETFEAENAAFMESFEEDYPEDFDPLTLLPGKPKTVQ